MKHKTTVILIHFFILLANFFLEAQTLDSSAYLNYRFIDRKANVIEDDSGALNVFYEKLFQIENNANQRVSIVHMGDSHIQADFFSGAVRQKMQLKFGNAGRGLIFPYRVARSNEPGTYKTATNTTWEAMRNSYPNKKLPIGVSAFTIETGDTSARLNLMVKDQPGLGYAFTKFSLFHEKGVHNFDITVCDETNCIRPLYNSVQPGDNPFVSQLQFDTPVRQIILRNEKNDSSSQNNTRIYGMLLENDSAGVLYNMIGANGAEYRHYNTSKYFADQLPYLKPELLIISLGTNDAYSWGFNVDGFNCQLDTLIMNIKRLNPNTCILLTTPPDSYRNSRRGKVKNPDIRKAKDAIVNYCVQNNLAYWDLYEIMGGYGSMAKWYAVGLASKDRIHFSVKGYLIQADLFYNALLKGYEVYKKKKLQ